MDYRFSWRSDGRLQHAELRSGKVDFYDLVYDDNGRHLHTVYADDGLLKYVARLSYDAAGRVSLVQHDQFPSSLDEAAFKADVSYRYEWQSGPCQPVFMPQLPPEFDPRVTGQASPTNVSSGCAP